MEHQRSMTAGMPPNILAQIQQLCREEIHPELDRLHATVSDLKYQMSLMGQTLGGEVAELKRQLQMREQDKADVSLGVRLKSESTMQDSKYDDTESLPLLRGSVGSVSMEELMADQANVQHSSQEYANILKKATQFYDLKADVWGAAELVIMKDFPDVAFGAFGVESVYRMGLVLFLLLVNLYLQFSCISFIGNFVMLPSIADVQKLYKDFHNECFIAGQFYQPSFDRFGDARDRICSLAISRSFLWICLFLWVAKCANELRLIYRRVQVVNRLPHLPAGVSPAHMAYEVKEHAPGDSDEPTIIVICLNRSSRVWLYSLIFVPRTIVACSLLVMGAAFLTATESDADLILNSLAMSFVYEIDEMLLRCFLPLRLAKNIAQTRMVAPLEEDIAGLRGRTLERANIRGAYLRSFAVLVCTLLFLVIWSKVQFIIPGYEQDVGEACDQYLASIRTIPCFAMARNCFPK